jgi:acetyltransferase-like isoleucine patch superfamily enzyme
MDHALDTARPTAARADRSRPGVAQYLATSDRLLPRLIRRLRRRVRSITLPAPGVVVRPLLWAFLAVRGCYYLGLRLFVCEPLFKAYCKQYGRGLRTGVYVHWVEGRGDIIVGDNVRIDGKCVISFAARFVDRPTLTIGDNSGIAHGCRFVVGKQITIGRNCRISGEVVVFDSSGHPADPQARRHGQPPSPEDVRPVVIGDDVWIGVRSLIFPGVRVGTGSVIAGGSVVRCHVPPYSVVAGNPARVVFRLARPSDDESGHAANAERNGTAEAWDGPAGSGRPEGRGG